MELTFYIASLIAIVATVLVIIQLNPVNALLYLVVSLLAVALIFFVIGAPFAAALEVIIYAGAIVVLFVFVVMMLNLGRASMKQERQWFSPGIWLGPAILAAILLAELLYAFTRPDTGLPGRGIVDPKQVGIFLYGPYLLAVELASLLLLAGLVGAYHLGRRTKQRQG